MRKKGEIERKAEREREEREDGEGRGRGGGGGKGGSAEERKGRGRTKKRDALSLFLSLSEKKNLLRESDEHISVVDLIQASSEIKTSYKLVAYIIIVRSVVDKTTMLIYSRWIHRKRLVLVSSAMRLVDVSLLFKNDASSFFSESSRRKEK